MAQSRQGRRHRRHSRRMRFGLPQTLMEIFAVPLILFVMSNPKFGMKDLQLPSLFITEPKPQVADSYGPSPYELEIRSDGKVFCDGNETAVDAVAARIGQGIHPDQGIRLSVETGGNGGGNVTSFMQVQANLSDAGLWSRVRIPHKSQHRARNSNERTRP